MHSLNIYHNRFCHLLHGNHRTSTKSIHPAKICSSCYSFLAALAVGYDGSLPGRTWTLTSLLWTKQIPNKCKWLAKFSVGHHKVSPTLFYFLHLFVTSNFSKSVFSTNRDQMLSQRILHALRHFVQIKKKKHLVKHFNTLIHFTTFLYTLIRNQKQSLM